MHRFFLLSPSNYSSSRRRWRLLICHSLVLFKWYKLVNDRELDADKCLIQLKRETAILSLTGRFNCQIVPVRSLIDEMLRSIRSQFVLMNGLPRGHSIKISMVICFTKQVTFVWVHVPWWLSAKTYNSNLLRSTFDDNNVELSRSGSTWGSRWLSWGSPTEQDVWTSQISDATENCMIRSPFSTS